MILARICFSDMASVDGSKPVQDSSDDGSKIQCSPCDYDGVKKGAKHYCPQCQSYLCDSCKSTHQKFSSTRKHQPISGNLMLIKHENNSYSSEDAIKSMQCSCNGKNVSIYCKEHNEVLCLECKALKHRTCNSSTIDEACADSETIDNNATKERMKTVEMKLEILQQRRNKDVETLSTKTAECRHIVKGLKRELMKRIEELSDIAPDDIEKCDREQRLGIEQHLHTCSTAFNRMKLDHKQFEEAVTSGKHPLIFVYNLQLKKTLEQVDRILKDVEKEVKEPGIIFDLNERLRMTDIKSLGVVRPTAILEDTRPVIAGMKIKSLEKVDVKFPGDQYVPGITGSLFVSNGELILCDARNSSVNVLNTDFTRKERIQLKWAPWDLCLIEDDEIVISQPTPKSLLFMKVVPKLQAGSSIVLDQVCRGVAVKDGLIYVSFDNGEIRILDRTGQQQRNVYSGIKILSPVYISLTSTGTLYVSENDGNTFRVLRDGMEIFKSGIECPRGIYIDGAGNIFVCQYFSHSIRVIDSNGQTIKVLLSETDGLKYPYTVNVRPNDNTLIVGGSSEQLVVCKMAEP